MEEIGATISKYQPLQVYGALCVPTLIATEQHLFRVPSCAREWILFGYVT